MNSPMVVEIDNVTGGRDAEMTMVTEFVVIGYWPRLPHFVATKARVAVTVELTMLTQRSELSGFVVIGNADT